MTNQPMLPRLSKATGPEGLAAEHVAAEFAGRFRWSKALGWLAWDGRRWSDGEDAESRALDAVRLMVNRRVAEHAAASEYARLDAEALIGRALVRLGKVADEDAARALLEAQPDDDERDGLIFGEPECDELADHRRTQATEREQSGIWLNMLQEGKVQAITRMGRRMDGVLTTADELDQHPDLLNVHNGVVDLRTGQLGPHEPALLLTKVAGAEYRPGATDPAWTAALQAAHPDLQDWLRLRFGQSATGHRPDDDVMIVNWGAGENGKSTVINAVMTALGDYAGLVPTKALIGSDPGAHSTELTTFRGLRMAVLEETPEEGRLDVHRVKMTVGTPRITARKIRQDDMTFETTHTMWINTNHMPQVTATDHGTWRRLVAVPWPFRFVARPTEPNERQGDRTLRPRVVDSPTADVGAAVLAWVVSGALEWYAAGRCAPEHPEAVLAATLHWREESDVALQFTRDTLVADDGALITTQDMAAALNEYVEARYGRAWNAATIKTRLTDALESAGIRAGYRQGRVPAGLVQSQRPALANAWGSARAAAGAPVQTGDKVRAWFGVRFRTSADDAHLRVASG